MNYIEKKSSIIAGIITTMLTILQVFQGMVFTENDIVPTILNFYSVRGLFFLYFSGVRPKMPKIPDFWLKSQIKGAQY